MTSFDQSRSFIKGDSYFFSLGEYFDSPRIRELIEGKRYTLNSTEATYRLINSWEEQGLIDSGRSKDTKWRKFSITDLVWIAVLVELRKYGLSVNKLKTLRQQIFYTTLDNKRYPQLEFYISQVFAGDKCVLMVFENGYGDIGTYGQYLKHTELMGLKSHLVISLNQIMTKIFKNFKFKVNLHSHLEELTYKELQIIRAIRNGSSKSIKVTFKDKEPYLIENETIENTENRIVDLLKKGQFQKIELTQQDGKIVNLTKTTKQKLD